jgi:hypothetical protein
VREDCGAGAQVAVQFVQCAANLRVRAGSVWSFVQACVVQWRRALPTTVSTPRTRHRMAGDLRFRDPRATRMTFAELVRDHYLPTYAPRPETRSRTSTATSETAAAKWRATLLLCDVALDVGLRCEEVTGLRPIDLVDASGRSTCESGRPGLVRERSAHWTILAKRSVLRGIMPKSTYRRPSGRRAPTPRPAGHEESSSPSVGVHLDGDGHPVGDDVVDR